MRSKRQRHYFAVHSRQLFTIVGMRRFAASQPTKPASCPSAEEKGRTKHGFHDKNMHAIARAGTSL
jgi:hypothetical protein